MHCQQIGRLPGNDEVEKLLCGKCLGAVLSGFLAGEPGEPDLERKLMRPWCRRAQRVQHRGGRTFGVRGTASIEPTIPDLAAERVDRHSDDAHRVGVRRKKEAGFGGVPGRETADDVRSSRKHLAEFDLGTEGSKELCDPFRAGLLAGVRRARIPVGVHRGNPHESLRDLGGAHALE